MISAKWACALKKIQSPRLGGADGTKLRRAVVLTLASLVVAGFCGTAVAQQLPLLLESRNPQTKSAERSGEPPAPPKVERPQPELRRARPEAELFEPENKPWRSGKDPLSHRDIEWLAREVGYRGAQHDSYVRNHLTANGLEYLDHIDNRQTGMQAVLVKDTAGDGRVYAIFRGTEPNYEFGKDVLEADLRDWAGGHLAIGKTQYETDKAELDEWARNHKGNITVTGHSLGAALGQRFIADNPDAVSAAVLFNAPGVEPELANRVPRDNLPPITYYLHRRDPVSNLVGYQHLYGTVNVVEGGDTDNYVPIYGRYIAHSAWMLQSDRTSKKQLDYDQHQAQRNSLLALEKAADKELRRSIAEMEGQFRALRAQIDAAQARAQAGAVSASNAASAAYNLLEALKNYQDRLQQGTKDCRAALIKRAEIQESGARIVKYGDEAAKGTKIAREKIFACASTEEVRAGLVLYDSAWKLRREALAEAKRVQQDRAELEALLKEATGARTLLEAAERAGQQIAAALASARAFGEQARDEAERLADLTDQLHVRKNLLIDKTQQFTASLLSEVATSQETLYFQIVEQKMLPLLERINAREQFVANAWADQADNHARRAEDILQQAQAIIAQLKALDFSRCDLVSAGDEAASRSEVGGNVIAAEEIDVELLQKANLCLARLSSPDALQTSAYDEIGAIHERESNPRAAAQPYRAPD